MNPAAMDLVHSEKKICEGKKNGLISLMDIERMTNKGS